MSKEIIITKDGSHSLRVPHLNETYHSTNGAITESQHVFITHGLTSYLNLNNSLSNIKILEMGFGTGLNALLSLEFAIKHHCLVNYTGVEAFPIEPSLALSLNYPEFVELHDVDIYFQKLHSADWDEAVNLDSYFQLIKRKVSFEDLHLASNSVDLIFFDAFAPSRQPEVWSMQILAHMYHCLKPGGFLVTYCAQGQFKRTAKAVGFEIEILKGPPGKNEMVRALKIDG